MHIETIDLVTPMPRAIFRFEALERRILMTIVAIDATAGLPFDGLVATDLHLPSYATGPELMNVMINGQWDYEPTAVKNADGSYDLYSKMTPQRAGTEEMSIWFRNDNTGSWDVLERGDVTVKDNHFSATVPYNYIYNRVAGTQFKEAAAIFTTSSLTQDLDNYVVDVNWYGKQKTGRLERLKDGTVAAYVSDAYLPTGSAGNMGDDGVGVTIRLKDAAPNAPVAGFASVYITGGTSIGFGFFYGELTSGDDFRIDLPAHPVYRGMDYHFFRPASELEGWDSDFTVDVTWQDNDGDIGHSSATAVRNADGSHGIVGTRPAGINVKNGMIRVTETVHRPAVDGDPAETYQVEYVGSFGFEAKPPGWGTPPPWIDEGEEEPGEPELPPTVDPSSDDDVDGEVTTVRITWNDDSPRMDSIADGMFSAADDQLLGEESEVDVAGLVG